MNTILFLLAATAGCALCKPEPQGFLESLAAALDGGIDTAAGIGSSILGTVEKATGIGAAANKSASGTGILGDLVGAAGSLVDGVAPKEGQKKARKKCKLKKKKDECPSRIRKTDRVVLNSQARDIIAKVYDFMKKEAMAEYAEKLTNARWRTATAVGVSEKTVSRILRDRNNKNNTGAATAGTSAIIKGKAEALSKVGKVIGDTVRGNFTGAVSDAVKVLGSDVAGDVTGLTIAASGGASAAGEIIGAKLHTAGEAISTVGKATSELIEGKLGAIANVGAAAGELLAGNFSAAASSFGSAVGTMVAADAAVVGTLVNGTIDIISGR